MAPEALPGIHAVDFRAPPPSPVAPGRRSSFANDDVLTEYLQQSLRVPDLILPDKVFPRQKTLQNPPKIDFRNLESPELNASGVEVSRLIAQFGCLEVINHGISRDLIDFVLELGNGVFDIPLGKKRAVARSPERRYGFEEIHVEEQIRDRTEEFIWIGEEAMRQEMEGIWPFRYSNFSHEMELLSGRMGEIGRKVVEFLKQHSLMRICHGEEESSGKVCFVQKQWRRDEGEEQREMDDVIRMLIRGSEFPHALCMYVWSGSGSAAAADFHVYSRKGWVSFTPQQHSLLVTIGDKLQAWSGGQYKHVIGRPVFKAQDPNTNNNNNISMGFLYSPSNITIKDNNPAVTISLTHQIILALLITLAYQFSVYTYQA